MTIAVDMGRKATKTNKQNQEVGKYPSERERLKMTAAYRCAKMYEPS